MSPNRTQALIRDFASSYLNPLRPLRTLRSLVSTIGKLAFGVPGLLALIAGLATIVMAGFAAVMARREMRAGSVRGFLILAAGAGPLVSVVAASALWLCPLLDYPRMSMFALPGLALMLGYAADTLLRRQTEARGPVLRAGIAGVCALAIVASQIVFFRYPRQTEDNRPAIQWIQSRFQPGDLLFVHGGVYEQFKYYRTRLGFQPQRVYIGNTQWPCCATGDREMASTPSAKDLASDFVEAARAARGDRLWLFLPAGSDGHWSSALRSRIQDALAVLSVAGCRQESQREFGHSRVESYACSTRE